MKTCECCGVRMVRVWEYTLCGGCMIELEAWTWAFYEEVLKACMLRMDSRLRSTPFFTPMPMRVFHAFDPERNAREREKDSYPS